MNIGEVKPVAKKQIENCIKRQLKAKGKYVDSYLDFIKNITDEQIKAISDTYWREIEHSEHYDVRIRELLESACEQEVL